MAFNVIKAPKKNDRKFPKARGPRPDLAAGRKERALARQEKRASMTPQQKLAALDDKFGPGLGAQAERARLSTQIDADAKAAFEAKPGSPKKGKKQV